MQKRSIHYFIKSNGSIPSKEFIDSLNPRAQKKVFFVFRLIEENEAISTKFFKKMSGTSGLWEVRIEYESNIYRLLGFLAGGKWIVLTNGFQKKSQRTPSNEIEIAESYKREYLERNPK